MYVKQKFKNKQTKSLWKWTWSEDPATCLKLRFLSNMMMAIFVAKKTVNKGISTLWSCQEGKGCQTIKTKLQYWGIFMALDVRNIYGTNQACQLF